MPLQLVPLSPVPVPAPPVFQPPVFQPPVNLQDVINPTPPAGGATGARRQRVEQEIGEKVGILARRPEEVLAVTRDGVLIEVRVSRYRGTARLSLDELGLGTEEMKNFAAKHLDLGRKLLLPKALDKALINAEYQARNAVYANGMQTAYGWFVPTRRVAIFKTSFVAAKAKFEKVLTDLCANLDAIKEEIRKEYTTLAPHAWVSMRAKWTEGNVAPIGTFAEIVEPTPLFVSWFAEAIVAQIPPTASILNDAVFRYELNILQAPDAELAKDFATNDATVNSELQEHLLARKKEFIDDFLFSMRNGLAENVGKLIAEVKETVGESAKVHGKTVQKILRALANLKDLNVTNDTDIERELSGVMSFVEAKSTDKVVDAQQVLAALQEASNRIAAAAKTALPDKPMFANLE